MIARLLATLDRRPVAIGLSVAVFALPILFVLAIPDPVEQPLGVDVALYQEAAARWLEGGPFYEPRQLAGPYEVAHGDILYPPVGLWLFVPFTVLPLVLWWAVPAGITAGGDRAPSTAAGRLAVPRPVPGLADDPAQDLDRQSGHLVHRRPGPGHDLAGRGAVRPAQAEPRAVRRLRHPRSVWWLGMAGFVALSIPFGAMWLDWLNSVVNSRGGGLLYSALEAPMLALPLVAWLGRPATADPDALPRLGPPRDRTAGAPGADSDQQVLVLRVGRDVLGHELAVGLDAQTPSADVGQHVLGQA